MITSRKLIVVLVGILCLGMTTVTAQEMTADQARAMRLADDKARQQKMMDELLSKSANDLSLVSSSYYTDFQKGLEYHLKGDHTNAKTYYEKCLFANPTYVDALYNLADIYSVRGDTQKALDLVKKAIDNGFSDVNGLYADEEMANLVASTPFQTYIKTVWLPSHQRAEELAVLAMAAYQKGDNQTAATQWKEAMTAEQSGSIVRPIILATLNENIGNAYLNLGYNQKAYDYLIKSYEAYSQLKKEPNIATAANNVAYALFGMLKTKEAVPYLEESLDIHKRLGMFNEYANDIINIAATYYQDKQYEKAFVYANKALEYAKMTGDENLMQMISANRASAMIEVGLFEEGIPILEKSIQYFQKNSKYLDIAIYKGNLGMAYKKRGDYQKAKGYFEESVKFHKQAGNKEETAKLLTYLSDTYEVAGDYKLALKYAQESYELYKDLDNGQYMVFGLQSVASIYLSMGQFPEAINNYNKALELCISKGLKESEETTHLGMGGVYRKMEDFGLSLTSLQKASTIAQTINDEHGLATVYTNLGLLYSDQNQDTEALNYFKKALALNQKLGSEHGISVAMANIASINYKTGNLMEAIESYKKSLAYFEERGELSQQLRLLSNIGAMYYSNQQANLAIPYFEKAVKIGERLRLEAEGNAKRDYLATITDDYRWLMYCHASQNDAASVFKVSEAIHGRVLGEQLGAKVVSEPPSISKVQSELGNQTALLIFTDPTRDIVQLAITNGTSVIRDEKSEPFVAAMQSIIQKVNNSNLIPMRGFKIPKNQSPVAATATQTETLSPQFKEDFEKIIMYYRSLLKSPAENSDREYLAKKLYSYLLGGLSATIQGKTELIIISDGILGYLPFETLIAPDGQYLAEKYQIKYVPSYAIYQKLQLRNYSSDRKDLLAFGGARYESTTGESRGFKSISSAEELNQLTFELLDDDRGFKKIGLVGQAYPKLGVGSWADLPGTLTEVQNIQSIYPYADVKINEAVSESNVKSMVLSNYKIVHFATHGIVVPEIPELSAIVLNQVGNTTEDGYLTMIEIQKLKFNADFVNLSACETGLGRIYGGEGVVGLTSAFLLSGANGVSASLWQVADESTMVFMTGVYQLMKSGKTPLSASTEMKRKFISGSIKPEYRHPFYWAPFVYYGK